MNLEEIKKLLGENATDNVLKAIQDFANAGGENFIPKAKFDKINEERNIYKQQVSEREKQISELKTKAGDNAELLAKINLLETQNKETATNYQKQLHDKSVETAFKLKTKDMTTGQIKLLNALIKKEELKLNEDESDFSNFDELVNPIKNDYGELFGIQNGSGNPANPQQIINNVPPQKMSLGDAVAEYFNQK